MGTLQTIKTAFRRIAPVGNPISLGTHTSTLTLTHPIFDNKKSRLYQSGTAALAAAVLVAKKRKSYQNPEVIIPAYGCPDLVSAIIYAQCKPVLVDIEGTTPYLKLDELETKLNDQTIAVIAPWFLGIPERFEEIRAVIQQNDTLLIEDSAQWFPEAPFEQAYCGDLVILSFGKGKPLSLLGGGLLHTTQSKLYPLFPEPQPAEKTELWRLQAKYLAFNTVLHPWFYWLMELLPISMGKTIYKPLTQLQALSDSYQQHLRNNICAYLSRPIKAQQQLSTALNHLSLTAQCETYQQQRLLRFPLLLDDPVQRDKVLQQMQQQGLGASQFYPDSLPNIEDIPETVEKQGSFAGSEQFAQRLITLPTHRNTGTRHVNAMIEALTALSSGAPEDIKRG